MRSIFAGMIILAASMAFVHTAEAQQRTRRPPGYGSMQALIGHRQPTRDELQPTQDDLEKIDKDNRDLELPASQDDIAGASQASWLDGEIGDVCPSCGGVEDAPVYPWSWPIYNGFNHQPTQDELRALHQQDVRAIEETDRLYDRLMSSSNPILGQRPAGVP
jgi:hypothetical protein